MAEIDSPWKEALDDFLQPFLAMCSPGIEERIDWNVPPESLDNELAKLFPDAVQGKRFVDRLFKVRLRDGSDLWVLIHIEVQAQRDDAFPERVLCYFYRLRDKFDLPVMCLVVLADESPTWRPSQYAYEFEGTRVEFSFPIIKLTDYLERIDELEKSDNLFALIILAHLQSQRVLENESRLDCKRRITRNLLERPIDDEKRWKVLKLVDWLMAVPLELNELLWDEIKEWKERNIMPYVTSFERIIADREKRKGLEEGREEGRQDILEGLEVSLILKFGDTGKAFCSELGNVTDIAILRSVRRAILNAAGIEDLRKLL